MNILHKAPLCESHDTRTLLLNAVIVSGQEPLAGVATTFQLMQLAAPRNLSVCRYNSTPPAQVLRGLHSQSSPLRKTKRLPATAKPLPGYPVQAVSTRTTRPWRCIPRAGTVPRIGGRIALSLISDFSGGELFVSTNIPLTLMSRVRPIPSCWLFCESFQKKITGASSL